LSSLKEAARCGANYIDIESKFLKEDFLKYINRDKTKVIVSYHNFDETPPLEELEKTCNQIISQGADILKIATMVNEEDDVRKITDLRKYIKIPAIIIGMGEKGKLTRVAPDNYLTFGALSKDEGSAPGQYTIEELVEYFKQNSN
jgi:3-dehydroquinate dehydratase-1